MARRARGRTYRKSTRSVHVTVDVPERYASLPNVLDAPPVFQRQHRSRTITVPLRPVRGPLVRKRFTIRYQPSRHIRSAYMAIDRQNRLRIYSDRKTRRYLATEMHRPRREERKRRKRRAHVGHLDSLRTDRGGIVAANRHRSMENIADAALVARALQSKGYI